MTVSSEGSAHPFAGPTNALPRDRHCDLPVISSRRLELARFRLARRKWIVTAGAAPASLPKWTSRRAWLDAVESWLTTHRGGAARTRARVSVRLVLAVSAALASHADHASGRYCAVTNARIAKEASCGERSVSKVRSLLAAANLAVEIRRGTGSAMCPRRANRPSVWHLISSPMPVEGGVAVPVDRTATCHLPPSRRDRRVSHVGNKQPSGCPQPPKSSPSRKRGRGGRCAPRPLQLQQLAAAITAAHPALGRVHSGHICAALLNSRLDLTSWTADQLNKELAAMTWPPLIHSPGAILTTRLRRLPPRPPSVAAPTRTVRSSPDAPAAASAPQRVLSTPAGRAAAIAYFQQHRAQRGRRIPGGVQALVSGQTC